MVVSENACEPSVSRWMGGLDSRSTPHFPLDLHNNQTYLSGMISDNDIERFEHYGTVPPLVDIEHWLEKFQSQKQLVEQMHAAAMGRKLIKCPTCKKGTRVDSLVFTDHYRYSPAGLSYDEPEWYLERSSIECPKCENTMHIQYDGSTKTKWDAEKQFPLRKYAKEIREDKTR